MDPDRSGRDRGKIRSVLDHRPRVRDRFDLVAADPRIRGTGPENAFIAGNRRVLVAPGDKPTDGPSSADHPVCGPTLAQSA